MQCRELRDYKKAHPDISRDFLIAQGYASYTADMHATWSDLCERQAKQLPGRACKKFLDGLATINLSSSRIPKFNELSEVLKAKTGWSVVPVPGLIPPQFFFKHLANRRFPAATFIRGRESLNYIEQPDVFHDVFGHVPMLTDTVFADFMQRYGEFGTKIFETRRSALKKVSRLYWYTVEFGLMETDEGVRIYGAGIVSSNEETEYSLYNGAPNRIRFDRERVMRTDYCISEFQKTYFVISSLDELFEAVDPQDGELFERLQGCRTLPADKVQRGDLLYPSKAGAMDYALRAA